MRLSELKEAFYDTWQDNFSKTQFMQEGPVESDNPLHNGRQSQCRNSFAVMLKLIRGRFILEQGSWCYIGANFLGATQDEIFGDDPEPRVDSYDILRGGYSRDVNSLNTLHPRVRALFRRPMHSGFDDFKFYANDLAFMDWKGMSNREIFDKNLELMKENAPQEGYDFIICDSDHSREGLQADVQYCVELLKPGGIIGIDDLLEKRNVQVRETWDSFNFPKIEFPEWYNDPKMPLISVGFMRFEDE
jgi:hypothetical protein